MVILHYPENSPLIGSQTVLSQMSDVNFHLRKIGINRMKVSVIRVEDQEEFIKRKIRLLLLSTLNQ